MDPVTMTDAVTRVRGWVESPSDTCQFVVTPNVDHVVQLYRRPELIPLYNGAGLMLADGWPLVTMSRIYGQPLPERVPGSDLLPELCDDFTRRDKPLRLFLLGGKPGVPERAAANIHKRWPQVTVVGSCSPPLGFEHDYKFNLQLCQQINTATPDILVVGLGFPKQELWIDRHRDDLNVSVALAVGGTIDFLAGEQTRAPRWIQSLRLEWLHRLATNPRRLAKRYAMDAIWFPWICAMQWRR